MCDCFHVVLPTWPGAPGSVSGRQLQPEEPGADTEDDHSVTEGPVDELIRPRPQGSSPVYECAAEDAASGLQEDAPGRHGSASRRWSWWKRDPGDSRTSSRMSCPEGATELTLETEAEAGASGYSVTGRDQGIFVKQVLKGSSAAKLFSLQEGDQLLSATVFFDNIKYEDALKILQYSEPYKVQFKIRRRLPASEDEEGASGGAQHGTPGQEGQDKDVTEVYTETPTKTAGGGGDRERLISKPRQERGRRPQKERLSWPRFHSVKSRRGPGPRRSLSSSETRGGGPDLSPTSTDTEAQLPAEQQEQAAGPGGQRRKRFLNLRLRRSKGAQAGPGHPEVLEEWRLWDGSLEGAGSVAPSREEEQVAQEPLVTETGLLDLSEGGTGGEVGRRRSKNGVKAQEEREKPRDTQAQPALKAGWEGGRDTVQSLEGATARLSLRDTAHGSGTQSLPQEVRVQIPDLKIPKFVFSKEKFLQTESDRTAARTGAGTSHSSEGPCPKGAQAGAAESRPEHRDRGHRDRSQPSKGEVQAEAEDKELREGRMKMPRFRIPSWGWSPGKEPVASEKAGEPEGTEGREVQTGGPKTDSRKDKGEEAQQGVDRRHQEKVHEEEQSSVRAEGGLSVGDKDRKLKKPKFKMPSFGVSAPRKPIEASADAGAPRVGVDVSLPSLKAGTSDHTTELPSASLGARTGQVGVRLTDSHIPKITQPAPADTHSLKGHLPPMKPPSTRMPKADLKGPEVHVKGPKVDPRGPKGELRSQEPDGPLPSLEIDIQMPGAQLQGVRLEGDVSLGDKDLAPKDSKFKMPKFKVPSFGVSSQDKSIKAEVDVSLHSVQADVETSDLTTEVSSADLETSAGQVGVTLPERQVPTMELPASDATGSLKGPRPKVKMPSVKMPKVDLKGPEVDVKGPKVDLQGPKEELSGPEMEVPLSSLDVSVQAPGAQLEGGRLDGDMSMKGTDLVPKDSKFKMPKFQMPSFGTSSHGKPIEASVDTSATKVEAEMSLPSVQADGKTSDLTIELPSGGLEASAGQVGMKLPGSHTPKTELPAPDATGSLKGHLPKVKMPSVRVPKVDLKGPDIHIKAPKVDLTGPKGELSGLELEGSLPSSEVDIKDPKAQLEGMRLEGDVSLGDKDLAPKGSKLKMPTFKVPSFGVSVHSKSVESSVGICAPSVQADLSLPSIQSTLKTGDVIDGLPSTNVEATAGLAGEKLPAGHIPEAEVTASSDEVGLKGHLPRLKMPSIKMPKVDLKGPEVGIKGTKEGQKDSIGEPSRPELEASLPRLEVDIQVPRTQLEDMRLEGDVSLEDKDLAPKDSKFKMPKFKVPSFGVSSHGKSIKAEVDVSLPSVQADVETSDLTTEVSSADLETSAGQVGVTLPERQVPTMELPASDATGSLKGHLPKVRMPSIKMPSVKMPKVDLKGPEVDVKGPKVDLQGPKEELSGPEMEVPLSSLDVSVQAPGLAQLEGGRLDGDMSMKGTDLVPKDSKFKMPKFQMPSFGTSSHGKPIEASVDTSATKVEAEMSLSSVQADGKTSDLTIELPSGGLEASAGQVGMKLPGSHTPKTELPAPDATGSLKGHLLKVKMPSVRVPKVDLKGPDIHIKAPKVDLTGPKGELSGLELEGSLPSSEVDIKDPKAQLEGMRLEGDVSLGDKDLAPKGSKLKMPTFKVPSFGVSVHSKSVESLVGICAPSVQADLSLPSIQSTLKTGDVIDGLPSTNVEATAGLAGEKLPAGHIPEAEVTASSDEVGLKGHLPRLKMPSIKMPKVDLKGPEVGIKGTKEGQKDSIGEPSRPELEASLPRLEVDIQVPRTQLEDMRLQGDVSLEDKDLAPKDSKFKMPKFKVPSFGVSSHGKSIKAEVDVSLPSVQADVETSDLTTEVSSADLETSAGQVGVTLPERQVPTMELPASDATGSLKGHLPKVRMPSIKMPSVKMPKVDLKGPEVDVKGPKVDLQGPKEELSGPEMEVPLSSLDVSVQAPGLAQLEGGRLDGDMSMKGTDLVPKDSKFKMPKFQMPSFGTSSHGKPIEASVDTSATKVEAEMSLPSVQADGKTSDLTIELPSGGLEASAGQVGMKLPGSHTPKTELPAPGATGSLKGHLPKVKMPSVRVPKVDLKGPDIHIKAPKVDLTGPKGELSGLELEGSLPSSEVDIKDPKAQLEGMRLEGDVSLGDKDLAPKGSKLKMPTFKVPSFGVSVHSKSVESSVGICAPSVQADLSLPSIQSTLKTGDVIDGLPSTNVEATAGLAGEKLPAGHIPEAEVTASSDEVGLKGHLPRLKMPSIKMPKVDLKGPEVGIKGTKEGQKDSIGEPSRPELEASLPRLEVDIQVPRTQLEDMRLEGDVSLEDKDLAPKDSKFKMPKFKVPSFGVSSQGKSIKAEVDVSLPSVQADVETSDLTTEVSSADLETSAGQVGVTLPERQVPTMELPASDATGSLKGHLPKVRMPSIKMPSVKMPKVDLKGPEVDVKGPKVDLQGPKEELSGPEMEVPLSSLDVSVQAPGLAQLEGGRLDGDMSMKGTDLVPKDSKFKMPKFQMPSFGTSSHGKPIEASVDTSATKVEAEMSLPSVQADGKTSDLTIELPSGGLEASAGQVGMKLPGSHTPKTELPAPGATGSLKGHLPKVKMPSVRVPKVDLKGPDIHIKAPKVDLTGPKGELSGLELEGSLPSSEVDIKDPKAQLEGMRLEGDVSLGDKDLAPKGSKLKMPTFKVPSFGVSVHSKSVESSVGICAPSVQADLSLPSIQSTLKTGDVIDGLPSTNVEATAGLAGEKLPAGHIPEAEVTASSDEVGLKGHLPRLKMPSIKMPKVDLKGPEVGIKGTKEGQKDSIGEPSRPELEASLPRLEVDIQVPRTQLEDMRLEGDVSLEDKDLAPKDSKFKMPKFKVPSFGVSSHGKSIKAEVDVSLPSVQADVETSDLTTEVSSADLETSAGQVGVTLPERQVPTMELPASDATGSLKGHLPKVRMPSIKMPSVKMPKVDLKGPEVDVKGPKVDLQGPKEELSGPEMEVPLSSLDVSVQAPGAQLEGGRLDGDMSMKGTDLVPKDSKFKMPKFQMPSFGTSSHGKPIEASVDTSATKVEAEMSLPSVQADGKTSDLTIELPSGGLEASAGQVGMKLPGSHTPKTELPAPGATGSLKGHLPKVKMPSVRVPKVDLKGPDIHIKAPKVDLTGPKGELSGLELEGSLPSSEVDIKDPKAQLEGMRLEGDVSLGDKDLAPKGSKLKMPTFKVPSFGVSVHSKSVESSVGICAPSVQADLSLPSIQSTLKTGDVIDGLPSTNVEATAGLAGEKLPAGHIPEAEVTASSDEVGLKGHLPRLKMPSIKMPKVDLKGPEVGIKGTKEGQKDSIGEPSRPELEASLPRLEVDIQVPRTQLEDMRLQGDVSLEDKDLAPKDSKFKMPKFKVPSFGVSSQGKSIKAEVDVSLPSVQADVETSDLTTEVSSADLETSAGQVGVTLPERQVPTMELPASDATGSLKGHLPKVRMPSIKMPSVKMPKVDLKGPEVDVKGPKVDLQGPKEELSGPEMEVPLSSLDVSVQAPGAQLEGGRLDGDMSMKGTDLVPKDSKFKMPKFQMPSFGTSSHGKPIEASVDTSATKVEAEMSLPSVQADGKTSDLTIELPSGGLEASAGQVGMKLPGSHTPKTELPAPGATGSLKGHLPKVKMPSVRVPKVDLKGPDIHIKAPKVDLTGPKGELSGLELEGSLPSSEVDIKDPKAQLEGMRLEGDVSLGDKDLAPKGSKLKMPTFKVPSFGVSVHSKSVESSVGICAPSVQADLSLPSIQSTLKTGDVIDGLPSTNVEATAGLAGEKLPAGHIPEAEVTASSDEVGLKGHLPRLKMPSIKMPKVDLKGPEVGIKGTKEGQKDSIGEPSRPELEASLPRLEVDIQVPRTQLEDMRLEGDVSLEDKDLAPKDSKFKMPKFKVPSFGVSSHGKSIKAEVDVSLPSVQADVETSDLTTEVSSADLETSAGQVGVTLPERQVPTMELPASDATGSLKGHLPKVRMPSIKMPSVKMPKVDLKGPEVDVKGPKVDLQGPKEELSGPEMEVPLSSLDVSVQAPGLAQLEGGRLDGDMSMKGTDLVPKDSKFKMPKFQMPSFGTSSHGKPIEASVDTSATKVEAEMSLPSVQADGKTSDLTIELPSGGLEASAGQVGMKLPGSHTPKTELPAPGATGSLKGHLPKVKMPSVRVLKVDLKGPDIHIKAPKVDLTGPKGELSGLELEGSLPSSEVDIKDPKAQLEGMRLEGDVSLGDKDLAPKGSKLKMPTFKVPSFGVSVHSKSVESSVGICAPSVQADLSLPSIQSTLKTGDVIDGLPSTNVEATAGLAGEKLPAGHIPEAEVTASSDEVGLKGHLPRLKMPSIKMPKVDLKGPEVGIKGTKEGQKDSIGEPSRPELEASLPRLEVDIQVPRTQLEDMRLEGDVSLEDKDLAPKDSKFKMPKFKVPSFGVSSHGKSIKAEVDVSLPSVQADVETSDLTTEVSSADLETSAGQVGVTLPERQVPTMELPASDATGSLKGHLPKVRMPSIKMPSVKMPKVDLKGPEVDVKGPKVDLQGPKEELSGPEMEVPLSSLDVSVQAPGAQLEGGRLDGDMSMKGTDLVPKDSKFKMPKFQMPSFGTSSHGKPIEASVDTSATKVEAEMSLPSVQADGKTSDLTIELPSGGLEASAGQVGMKLPGSHTPKTELPAPGATGSLKGHLPKVKMPSVRVPKVDLKGPKVDVRGPKVDLLGPHGKLGGPPLAGSPPALEVDFQAFESQEAVTVLGADVSASLPHRERTAPTAGDLLPTSCRKPDAVVSIVGKPEGAGPKEAAPSAQGSWFRLPRFRLPGFGRSSSQESSGAGEQVQGEAVAQDKALDAKASAATSPQSPEVDAAVSTSGSASQSGVVRWDLDDTGLPSPLPTFGVARAELPTTQASTLPASAPLPLQERPCGPRSPGRAPALTRAQERAGPQGPLVLTASHADEPVQTAAVRAGPLWEDSVLTVRFPRLTVPRFSFPAHSAEADIFIPTVKEVHWLEAGPDAALPEAGPTLWEASVLKAGAGAPWEQPVALGLPLEAPPVSKVRVHIQGAQGESQEVTTHGRETPELAGVSAPQAPCTQIVRASEIPASTIQMPSYGFSLLTVKIPEPPMQAEVCTVMLDAWRQEGSEEVPTQATAGVDRISGDPLSDTGGPFEIVSSSGDVPGAQALTSALHPDCQLADGCSEEEQVEILELLPEDSRGETPPPLGKDGAAKERPESKRAGLFWAWLPDIGFSSSVEEPSADSKEAHPRATPVQTQPGVQPQADLLKRQEKAGWFRFPRLGFSSAKKGRSSEDKADLVEQSLQEETVTFFDARESFCPEEQEDGDVAEVACTGPHPGVMAARTELPLTEQDKASADPTPRLVAK